MRFHYAIGRFRLAGWSRLRGRRPGAWRRSSSTREEADEDAREVESGLSGRSRSFVRHLWEGEREVLEQSVTLPVGAIRRVFYGLLDMQVLRRCRYP